jgi:hypothetical protein
MLKTRIFKFHQIRTKHQFQLLRLQSLQRTLQTFSKRQFFAKIGRHLWLINPKSINLINNQWPGQANNHRHTNTISGLDQN